MRLNAKQIAAYTGGQFLVDPIDASALMTGITWDSREVRPGWLYVALPGERVDGHAFVEAALRAGAAGALVTDGPSQSCALLARELGAAIIEVPNTASAITDLARAWRSHLRGRVIGLTGSVGKTTTKNLTRDVCAAYGSVVATKANQNNELGVPRTLLNADPETAVVVVEMGMRGRGQIAELCDFVRPVWGLITNVGESHIELLGSRENIARAKSELFEALPAGVGRAFANLDDDFAAFMAERGRLSERSVALSGFAGHPDAALRGALERESAACDQAVWAEDVSLDAEGRPRFTLCARDAADHDDGALFATVERVPCALSLTGAHNVDNACAAASVGFALGLDLATIAAALGASVPEPGRQEVIAARGGFTVINDAYNASPDSMRASLATFAATDVAGRRIAVLGDMGELGSFAPACHEGVGAAAASHHLDKLKNDCVRVVVCKQLRTVDNKVITFLVADKQSAVAVKNIAAGGGDNSGILGYRGSAVVALGSLDYLHLIQKVDIYSEQRHQHHHERRYSSGFYKFSHRLFLIRSTSPAGKTPARRAEATTGSAMRR